MTLYVHYSRYMCEQSYSTGDGDRSFGSPQQVPEKASVSQPTFCWMLNSGGPFPVNELTAIANL